MPKAMDLTGQRFGRLSVVCLGYDDRGIRLWECCCDCGKVHHARVSRLVNGNETECSACAGTRTVKFTDRTCVACGVVFRGHYNAACCSETCRKNRRRGLASGVTALPPPTIPCVICGNTIHVDRGIKKTCSPECHAVRSKARGRAFWRKRVQVNPDLPKQMNRRKRERAASDSTYAAKVAEWDAGKYERHRLRMESDPNYAARHRKRANERYANYAETIQAKRRERLMALSDDDLAELRERMRRYQREHRRRRRADPIIAARDQDIYREWRRRRNGGLLQIQAAALMLAASARLDDPTRIKPCIECGKPIVGKRSTALACSRECARVRVLRQIKAARIAQRVLPADRSCVVCGTPLVNPKANRVTCSDSCRAERKRLTKIKRKKRAHS